MRANVEHYDLVAPSSLEAVMRLLAERPGVLTPLAGGTELMVALNAGRLAAHHLISLASCSELRFINVGEEAVTIGACTTFKDLRLHPGLSRVAPLLSQAAGWIGGIANQNRGTIGGNVANASPAADSSPVLLVYDAQLQLVSATGVRSMPYRDFHQGYKQTALRRDELIGSITIPLARISPSPAHGDRTVTYLRKVGTRNAMAVSKVVLAGVAQVEGSAITSMRLAGASLAEIPLRLVETERILVGEEVTPALINAACASLIGELRPIDDIRSTAQYRSAVAANLLREFLTPLSRVR